MDESLVTEESVFTQYLVEPILDVLELTDAYEYERTDRLARYTFATTSSGAGEQVFHLLVMENTAHRYPNGKTHPISLPNIYWQFFSQYSL